MTTSMNRRQFVASMSGFAMTPCLGVAASLNQTDSSAIEGVSATAARRIAVTAQAFQRKFKLPGISLAMSYRGQLKLRACFGFADKDKQTPVTPKHAFRIASVSKPITAVTILKLLESGKLKLDQPVFAAGGPLRDFLPSQFGRDTNVERVRAITIRHLLHHTAGGWGNRKNDPMFDRAALKFDHRRLIEWTLKNRPLEHDPGSKYGYSNFGYCLLGRVIEKLTGQSYENATQKLVLKPAGADGFVGHREKSKKAPTEVAYYGKYDPYGAAMNVARMDSHGGWVFTATDLIRFAQSVDGYPNPKDLLAPKTLKLMTTPSAASSYALGWQVNKHNNWWHQGSFNGGSSILVRTNDGHCWAILVNSRSHEKGYSSALDRFGWNVKNAAGKWGKQDLFKA